MLDENLLFRLFEERNIKSSTRRGYVTALKNYTAFCNKSLNDLLVEALNDEKNMVMSKDRLLKQHLIDYRMYLIKSGIATSTIKNYLSKVKTFYKH